LLSTSFFLVQGWIRSPAPPLEALKEAPETETEVEKASKAEAETEKAPEAETEEAINDPFRPPLTTAPAALPVSRAGRKRAPIMKALEAEKAPKRGMDGGKSRRAKG
jgi:hypothetical protein